MSQYRDIYIRDKYLDSELRVRPGRLGHHHRHAGPTGTTWLDPPRPQPRRSAQRPGRDHCRGPCHRRPAAARHPRHRAEHPVRAPREERAHLLDLLAKILTGPPKSPPRRPSPSTASATGPPGSALGPTALPAPARPPDLNRTRGNNVMKGYFGDPAATARAFAGGWFHSGDVAVMHPDGYIEVRDRMKDVIISGGENISTIEVENTICRHPVVLECAVVAIPDEKWASDPRPCHARRRPARDRAGNHRFLPAASPTFQGSRRRRVHRPAQDLDRQSPEERPARTGLGRIPQPRQLTPPKSQISTTRQNGPEEGRRFCGRTPGLYI